MTYAAEADFHEKVLERLGKIETLLDEVATATDDTVGELEKLNATLTAFYKLFKPSGPVGLTMTLLGGANPMTTFNVDTTDGTANLQFVDDHGDLTAGPNDSITGAPVEPTVTSDTPTVLTAGGTTTSAPSGQGGAFTAPLTMVAEGTANVSVEPLVNSDGSPVVDSAGNPFTLPAPIEVTVEAGAAEGLTMTVTG